MEVVRASMVMNDFYPTDRCFIFYPLDIFLKRDLVYLAGWHGGWSLRWDGVGPMGVSSKSEYPFVRLDRRSSRDAELFD